MDNSTIVFLINDDARAMKVRYDPDKLTGAEDTVVKTLDPSLEKGDYVVVQTDTRHGMTVARITEADVDINFDTARDIKWIVQRVDYPGFENVLSQERDAVTAVQTAERRRKRAALRDEMMKDHEGLIGGLAITKIEEEDKLIEGGPS